MTTAINSLVHSISEPDRFWTLANIGEVTPGIMTPSCWSLWEQMELAIRQAWADLGIMSKDDCYLPSVADDRQTACFYGRHAMNVDLTREYMGQIPGASADDFERDICGSVRENPPATADSVRRLPAIAVKTPLVMARNATELKKTYDDQYQWWLGNILSDGQSDPAELISESIQRFTYAMRLHVRTRCVLQATQSGLTTLAEKAGVPELSGQLFSGFGDVTETQLADSLWRVSRGEADLDSFIADYGFHGPNEGMVWTQSWRENRTPLTGVIGALATRPDSDRPLLREQKAKEQRIAAEEELLDGLNKALHPVARFLFRKAGAQVRNLELGKAAYLMAIDGCRAATRRAGLELVTAGALENVEDAFFLTAHEHASPPSEPASLVETRKIQHEEFEAVRLPMTFTGIPEPQVIAEAADQTDEPVTGIGASSGVVTGLARVILDPNDDEIPDEGEILVCRVTDPSWAAHFTLVAGVVIDIGSSASHGAIVARELGLPCVINTGDGTSRIRTGDLIRVDGDSGAVMLLERADRATKAVAE